MLGSIKSGENSEAKEASFIPNPNQTNLVAEVSAREKKIYYPENANRIVLIDCGVKYGIIRNLLRRRMAVIRVPFDTTTDAILQEEPVGVVVSNGPGDPKICQQTTQTIHQLIEYGIPILGICLGNQLIALAEGGDTYKMKYGHRSQNQPVLDVETARCYITTQNHGYAVEKTSLEQAGLQVWFVNANDHSIEGIKHPKKPCMAVQWHPEASPGPTDTEFIFDHFLKEVRDYASA